jgi:protein SCO1/2
MTMIVVILLVGCTTPATPTATPAAEGVTIIEPPLQPNAFTLTDQNGKAVRFDDLKGKLTLLTFGFTHCPDVCPVTLANFKSIKADLADEAGQVNFVFVSVDGARDTPEVMNKYLALFDPAFIGLTGDEATLQKIVKDYGAVFYKDEKTANAANYTVTHTSSSFLVDRSGQLRRKYAYGIKPETVAADIRTLIKT